MREMRRCHATMPRLSGMWMRVYNARSGVLKVKVLRRNLHLLPWRLAGLLRPASVRAALLLCAAGCGDSTMAADLRGVVLDSGSGSGIPAALVRLTHGGDLVSETATGEGGEFTFEGLPKGKYRPFAEKDGYLDLLAPLDASGGVILPERGPGRVELRLTRACAISGRVFDVFGQPARNIRVLAVVRRSVDGVVRLAQEGQASLSDDRGIYRIYGLAPGKYAVEAIPQGEQVEATPFAPVYFPGVVSETQAEIFGLKSGEAREGVDLSLVALPTSNISGRVTQVPGDWTRRSTAVSILASSGRPLETKLADAEGRFSFRLVPPGSYRIVAWGPVFAFGDDGPVAGPNGQQGSRHVHVGSADVNDVEVELCHLATVKGQVAFNGASSGARECYARAQVILRPLDAMPGTVTLRADLTQSGFTLPDVPMGRFRLGVRGLGRGCYVQQISATGGRPGRDASDVVIVGGDTSVTLVLGGSVAEIHGTVAGPDGGPPRGSAVVLVVPSSSAPESGDPLAVPTDAAGRYRIEAVRPGAYELLALNSVDSNDYLDPAFWDEHGGVSASVQPTGSIRIDLRIAK